MKELEDLELDDDAVNGGGILSLAGGLAPSSGGGFGDGRGGFDRDLARDIISIPLSIPVRPVGYHLCTDSQQWVGILDMIMATLCKFVRLRMRIHRGTLLSSVFGASSRVLVL